MKSICFLGVALVFFSCNSSKKEVYQGPIEEVISGEMGFERDLESGYLPFQEAVVYQGKEMIYTKWNDILNFYDPATGRKISTFKIPKEGPESIKGGTEIAKVFADGLIAVTNSTGATNLYQNEKLFHSFMRDIQSYEPKGYLYFPENGNALHQISSDRFELTFNPFNFMAFRENKDALDLNFGSWIGAFDTSGTLLCKSDFRAPYEESYKNSSAGGRLVRMVDAENSWLMFPYSDSLYRIENCQIVQRLKLDSKTAIQYLPETFKGDSRSGSWIRPENGAINTYLIRDLGSNTYVRLVHLSEKRSQPDEVDPRKRMFLNEVKYLLLVYNLDWELQAELEVTYPVGTRFENLFSTSQGLFINKPEQLSDDEYEFYRIDLARFGN